MNVFFEIVLILASKKNEKRPMKKEKIQMYCTARLLSPLTPRSAPEKLNIQAEPEDLLKEKNDNDS